MASPVANARLFLLSAPLILAAFSGCSQKPAAAPQAAAQATASAPAAAAPAAPAATTPTAATAAAPPPTSSDPALATTDGETPGVKIAVTELKRTSGTLTLKFTVLNGGDKEFSNCFDGDPWCRNHNLAAVHLIDGVSKKKYFVVTDSDGSCVCSNGISGTAAKSQMTLWAKFPAPPDDVQKITVEIPHFVPLEDVPISR